MRGRCGARDGTCHGVEWRRVAEEVRETGKHVATEFPANGFSDVVRKRPERARLQYRISFYASLAW